jgi:hypothetical protein
MTRMKRVLFLGAFVGVTGMTVFPALAGPPRGGCPPSPQTANQWERVTVQSLVDQGLIVAGAQGVDLNDNGFTCVMFPPGQGAPAGIPTIRDDTVPPSAP